MDLSLYPQAMAMSAKEFVDWSRGVMDDLARTTGVKKAVDKIADPFINWGVRNSIYPLHFGIACCALEMAACSSPRYDNERLGMVFRSSPRQTDVLLVNGWVTHKLRPALRRLYEQMPEPKWVIAMGECAISGGPWYDSYNTVQGVDSFIPVDVYIPGCPPRPEAMIDGFLKLHTKIKNSKIGTFMDD
ncbi:MAG: NADH-quinone oxidoreductase subunit B [Euryarchaeota archaeon]|nr:NADH-quinone oxidoreductase subunit B [Euryarchaeota archaeon]